MTDVEKAIKAIIGDVQVISVAMPSLSNITAVAINGNNVLVAKQSVYGDNAEDIGLRLFDIMKDVTGKLENAKTLLVLGTEPQKDIPTGKFTLEVAVLAIGD